MQMPKEMTGTNGAFQENGNEHRRDLKGVSQELEQQCLE